MIKPVKCGCGGKTIIYINGAHQAKIYCEKCGIESNVFATKHEAIKAWNRAMGERTAKVKINWTIYSDESGLNIIRIPYAYKCGNCGCFLKKGTSEIEIRYCPSCGARLEWT